MLETPLTILEFILVLGLLIIVHELGHFLLARLFKIEVEEFGVGYPPRVHTLFEAGGTKYTLNLLPFGGFVRLKGENDPSAPGSFAAASPWKRIAVLVAGPMMNLLTAVILYVAVISLVGLPDPTKVEIMEIAPGSPAEQVGLRPGDIILRLNDQPIESTEAMSQAVRQNLGKEIALTVLRGSQEATFRLVPRLNPPEGQGAIGIAMGNPTTPISPWQALPYGVVATYEHGRALLLFIGRLAQGQVAPEEGRLVGFKGMYDLYAEMRSSEPVAGMPAIVNVLAFVISVTISLGFLNLLPFPALDGGRIVFILPEIVLRKRIPPQYESWVNLVGFAILILLLIYINLQDFLRPVTAP